MAPAARPLVGLLAGSCMLDRNTFARKALLGVPPGAHLSQEQRGQSAPSHSSQHGAVKLALTRHSSAARELRRLAVLRLAGVMLCLHLRQLRSQPRRRCSALPWMVWKTVSLVCCRVKKCPRWRGRR